MSAGRIFLSLMIVSLSALPAQQPEGLKIVQAEKRMTIDGDLSDWGSIPEVAVHFSGEGQVLAPSADLTVTARFSFDSEFFYAAVNVLDDQVEFPDMSRREGDGFYLTFVSLEKAGESGPTLVFGFSRFGSEPVAFINRPEEAGAAPARDVQLQIKLNEPQKSVVYELAIPWKYIPFFRPFFQSKLGINLTYDDLDGGKKKIVQLAPDPGYLPENPAPKKSLSAEFVVGSPRALEFQSALNANHFYPQDERKFNLAVLSPEAQTGWQVRMILTTPLGNVQSKTPLSFAQGMNILSFPVELEKTTTGIYELSVGLIDEKGTLRYTDDRRFFLLDQQEFDAYDAKLGEIKKGEAYAKDIIFKESLPTLEVRLKWVRDFMEKSPSFADLEPVEQWDLEIKDLFKLVEEAKPALFPSGRVSRLGYRSEADGALRSYSVFVPDWYSEKIPLPLLVTLSGRAVEVRRAMFGLVSSYFGPRVRKRAGDFFILAPEVDDPAGWYTGASAERVIESIAHLAKVYSVNLKGVVVDGFANGGYGALRLALQNPGTFRGVIVRSGIFVPPPHSGAESILDMLDRVKGLDILVVHGEREKGAPLEEARRVVSELQQAKANVSFVEVKGRGPEDFEGWDDVFGWLRTTFGDTAVDLKPPKREKEKEREEKKPPLGA